VLYITDRRYVVRTNAVTGVKVYSNAHQVELVVNGKSQGSHTNTSDVIYRWADVKLLPGTNLIEAVADFAGQQRKDSCEWHWTGAEKKK
jgi:hypothetical protein